ncbi:hypothetical protein EIG11_26620 [Escherichia coli]|nr:hypothetical protein [Escherichia coli]
MKKWVDKEDKRIWLIKYLYISVLGRVSVSALIRLYPPCNERKLTNINLAQKVHKTVSALICLILKRKNTQGGYGRIQKIT